VAQGLLRLYSTPKAVPRGLTFVQKEGASATVILLDLYQVVRVLLTRRGVDANAYIIGVEHSITPTRWETSLRLRPVDAPSANVIAYPSGVDTYGPSDLLPDGLAKELGSDSNLDALMTPGVYTQVSNTNAVGGTGYPAPYAGLLEVFSNNSQVMLWQRYTTYGGAADPVAVYVRGFSGGGWSAWRFTGAGQSGQGTLTSATTISTSTTTCPGMAVSLNVTRLDQVFIVTATFDLSTLMASPGTFVGRLTVNGTAQSVQAIWATSSNGARQAITQTWRISGLALGTVAFACTGTGTVASAYRANAGHSTLTVSEA
jgi:hypothetical protein